MANIRVVQYSDKSIAVFGDTFYVKDELLKLGGKFNKYLRNYDTRGPGWVFHNYKRRYVELFVASQQKIFLLRKENERSTTFYPFSDEDTIVFEEIKQKDIFKSPLLPNSMPVVSISGSKTKTTGIFYYYSTLL